jgi:lysophospholipase L1-like esterase
VETLILLLLSLLSTNFGSAETTASATRTNPPPGAVVEAEPEGPPAGANARGPRSALIVGDSLSVGAAPHIESSLRGWDVETLAREGKHTDEGVAEITSRSDLPPVLIVSLGTNDDPSAVDSFSGYVQTVLDAAGPAGCVVWPTIVRPPYNGVSYNGYNRALARLYATSPNLRLVDWGGIVASNPGVLSGDGVHATPAGYAALGQAIAQAARTCGSGIGIGD